jgi:hypothetical protein
LSLLIGAAACALWRLASSHWRPALEYGMLGLALACVPYGVLLDRAADPLGAYPRRFAEFVESHDLPGTGGRMVILFGAEGLASEEQAERSRQLVYGAGLLKALYPETELSLRLHDLNLKPGAEILRPRTLYAVLQPDLTLEPAGQALLDRRLTIFMKRSKRRDRFMRRSRGED